MTGRNSELCNEQVASRRRMFAIPLGVALALVPMAIAAALPSGGVTKPAEAEMKALRVGLVTQVSTPVTAPPASTTIPTTPPTDPPAGTFTAEQTQMLDLINNERTTRGLQPLTLQANLNTAAQAHTERMSEVGAIFHEDPRTGTDPGDRITNAGYTWGTYGENVAAGQPTVASVMLGWMKSEGHCSNILDPGFTEIGVGYVVNPSDQFGVYWTQNFARSLSAEIPPGTYDPAWCPAAALAP